MQETLRVILPILIASSLATSCTDPTPEISDQQILDLFDNRNDFFSDGTPGKISKQVEECVRLMAGLDKEIYKDLPEALAGQFKTECRKDFSKRLANANINPMGLKLPDLETPEFAERLTRVRAQADERAMAAKKAEREKQAAEKLAKDQAALTAAKAKAEVLLGTFEERLAAIKARCMEWNAAKEAILKSKKRSPWRFKFTSPCSGSYAENVRSSAQRVSEELPKLDSQPFTAFGGVNLYFGQADPDEMDEDLAGLEKDIAEMKAELAGD